MPQKKPHVPPGAKSPGQFPYTPAISVGETVFVSGQGPIDPATGSIKGETLEEQVELTLDNVRRVLESAGCTMDDCVKITAYMADLSVFNRYNVVYSKYFNEPRPARTTVQAALWSGILIEIDAIAIRGCASRSNDR